MKDKKLKPVLHPRELLYGYFKQTAYGAQWKDGHDNTPISLHRSKKGARDVLAGRIRKERKAWFKYYAAQKAKYGEKAFIPTRFNTTNMLSWWVSETPLLD